MGRSPMDFQWPAEAEETVRRMWGKESAREIAAALFRLTHQRVSRNAIVGKAHRMSLPGLKKYPEGRKARREHQAKPREPNSPRTKIIMFRKKDRAPIAAASIPDCDAPPPLMLSVMSITDSQCHYPIGDPKHGDFGYCGHSVRASSSYCPDHHRIVWVPLSNRQRRTDGYHFSLPPDGLPAKRAPRAAA